ncbi:MULTISPECIES: response regulator [Geodermatophilus]|uniref:Two component transcriptional regulator, LuxR family n=1 Tax=Geodermatophilus nigrescens TaxID=1070870 RepID=A0A1M5K3S5_9ACTN|nr:response regulator transcription factor [Geodermatophilus nigrescens]SHG47395.1 two component transcriptional regulator, LuxR family [Geodermatophilus nigrescens]
MSTRVLLVDDEPLVRLGFSMVLQAQDDLVLVGEAGDGARAVSLTRELRPDVVVMDVRMPGVDGVEATRRIVAEGLSSRVLVLTTFDLDEYAFAALRAGASAFLLKNAEPAELLRAVRAVARGDAVLSPRVTRRLLETLAHRLPAVTPPDPRVALLTERELEVLRAVARGESNAEIAGVLVLSELTVKTHVARILGKLGLRDRTQAAVFAHTHGLV